MDAGVRQKRVEALEKIKEHALGRAKEGADPLEVRDFVTSAKKELAYSASRRRSIQESGKSDPSLSRFKSKLKPKIFFH
jgi:hypothetical protein